MNTAQHNPKSEREDEHRDEHQQEWGFSRRQLLGAAGTGAALAALPSSARAVTKSPAQTSPAVAPSKPLNGDGILVYLTLYGGNDGLDTVIPAADPAYQAARGSLAIPSANVLALRDGIGIHPSLKRVHTMFQAGKVSVIQGVGYPDPSRSHFRSMDIWQSGVPERVETSGWLGRWHDLTGPDPLRMVNVAASVPRAMISSKGGGPASIPNGRVSIPAGLIAGFTEQARLGGELGPLGSRLATSMNDLLRVRDKFGSVLTASTPTAATNLEGGNAAAGGYDRSVLDNQLETVSSILNSGSPARVFAVSLGGFDTHASERDQHARLLAAVDGALGRFFDRLAGKPMASKVVVMVFSEFGRRVSVNLSEGTDHGTAAPMFVIGDGVKGALVGDHPSLTKLDSNGDLMFTVDFREVYAATLASVLGIDPKGVLPTIPTSGLKERIF